MINRALLIVFVAASVAAWPTLPDRIPLHFSISGRPDRWVDASPGSWFLVPALAIALALFLRAIVRWARGTPALWNVPEKAKFLALPEDERLPIVEILTAFVSRTTTGLLVLLMVAQLFIYTTATGRTAGVPWLFDVFLVALLGSMVFHGIRMNRRIGRLIREATRAREMENA